MAISKEAVWAAADELTSRNAEVTLGAIREIVGGGSYSTIGPFTREWKAKQAVAVIAPPIDVPENVDQAGTQLMQQIWAQACVSAERRLAAEREALAEARRVADAEVEEAIALADRIDCDLATAKERIALLEQQAAAQAMAHQELERTLAAEVALRTKAEAQVDKRDQALADMWRHAEEHLERCAATEGQNQVLMQQNERLQTMVDRMTQHKSPA